MDASAVRVPPLQRFSSAPRLQGRILAPQDAWHLSPCPLPQQLQLGVWESFRSAFIAKFARTTPICYSVARTSCLYRLPVVSSQVWLLISFIPALRLGWAELALGAGNPETRATHQITQPLPSDLSPNHLRLCTSAWLRLPERTSLWPRRLARG